MRRRLFQALIVVVVGVAPLLTGVTCNPNLRDDFIQASQRQESACAQLALAAVEQGRRDAARTNMLGAMRNTVEDVVKSNEELAAKFEEWAVELRAQRNAVCLPMTGVPTPTAPTAPAADASAPMLVPAPTPPISRYFPNVRRNGPRE